MAVSDVSDVLREFIEPRRSALEELCRTFHVRRLELFGSAVSGRFRPDGSDLDFLVEFGAVQPGQHFDAYFGLREALEQLFQRPVDLVMVSAIRNPYFLESANRTRRVLYAA